MRKFLGTVILSIALSAPSYALASDGGAQWHTFGPFFDSLGTLYTGIKIDVYSAGTTTNKTYWADEGKATAGAHPLVDTDTDGIVGAFFDGEYRFRVKDSDGLVLDAPIDWDNVKVTSDTGTMWEGNCGTAFPTVATSNRWQMACKHTAGNELRDIAINDGTKFVSLWLQGASTFSSANYDDCSSAISSIGAAVATLVVSADCAITATVTAPTTLTWRFEGAGAISPITGTVLTINGAIEAPLQRVFICIGSEDCVVPVNLIYVYPQWWGGSPSATAAVNNVAIQAALNTVREVVVSAGTWNFSTMLKIPDNGVLGGQSNTATVLKAALSTGLVGSADRTVRHFNIKVHDLEINNTSRVTAGGIGLDFFNVTMGIVRDVIVRNVALAVEVSGTPTTGGAFYNTFDNVMTFVTTDGYSFGTLGNENTIRNGRISDTTNIAIATDNNTANIFDGVAIEVSGTGISVAPTAATQLTRIMNVRFENAASGTGILNSALANGTHIFGPFFSGLTTNINDLSSTTVTLSEGEYAQKLLTNKVAFGELSGGTTTAHAQIYGGTGTVLIRNSADSGYVDIDAKDHIVRGIVSFTGVAFSALAGSDGSLQYCSDCTIASPCAAGGTGAIAKRLNGVWICN